MDTTCRVLVTGSRDWPEAEKHRVTDTLQVLHLLFWPHFTVVHGDCPTGADAFTREWCEERALKVTEERHPADWDTWGAAAGPRRNREMVAKGADVCLAYVVNEEGKSRGTRITANLAFAAGIPVMTFESGTSEETRSRGGDLAGGTGLGLAA